MLRCIHCDGLGIGIAAKRWSGREAPAKCAKCGGLSHVIASTGSGIPVATLLIILAFAALGAANGNPLLGAFCGLPVAVIYNVWAWAHADMFPISPKAMTKARAVSWVVNVLTLLGILGS